VPWPLAQPAQFVLGQGCVWQNTPLCSTPFISSLFVLISSQTELFEYKKNPKKDLWTPLNLFVDPSCFFL